MTDEEFAAGVDAILLTGLRGHASHRALDLWWTRYAVEKGGPLADATKRWMGHIEGGHRDGLPYPLGRRWWHIGPLRPKLPRTVSEWGDWTCP